MKIASHVALFISSTFDDTLVERNYMLEHAYPLLKAYCMSHRLSFSVVDLRWGIRDAATDDHNTIEICLGEIRRCLQQSTAAGFVFLSGERYGWRALPNPVLASEFECILGLVGDGEGKDTLEQWYLRDDNAVPPIYVLQSISHMAQRHDVKYNAFWGGPNGQPGAERVMQEAVRGALASRFADGTIDPAMRNNWTISVTEREVLGGMLNVKQDGHTEIGGLVLMRTLGQLEEAVASSSQKALTYYTAVQEDRLLLHRLRDRVKHSRPRDVVLKEYSLPWTDEGLSIAVHKEYVRELASDFVREMVKKIEIGSKKRKLLSVFEKEALHHHTLAFQRGSTFLGRLNLRDTLRSMTFEKNSFRRTSSDSVRGCIVKCVYGASGTGKTSLMCIGAMDVFNSFRTAEDTVAVPSFLPSFPDPVEVLSNAEDTVAALPSPDPVVVFRACGTSNCSTTVMDLLRSVCSQIRLVYGTPPNSKACASFEEQVQEFHACLSFGSQLRPLFVFIDSLDQLSNKDNGCSQPWSWLPMAGSEALQWSKIIVSTLPESQYLVFPILKAHLPETALLPVTLLSEQDSLACVKDLLLRHGRTVSAAQESEVNAYIKETAAKTMLHIRLIFDRLKKLRSFGTLRLAASVPAMINHIYSDIEAIHGKRLVEVCMGLLCASKGGLSTENLLDLISCDDAVLGEKGEKGAVFQYHAPPCRRLPTLVFTRLQLEFQDYLVERGDNGVMVLNLYHRQFWEVARARYFKREVQSQFCIAIASYFSGSLASRFPERFISANELFFTDAMSSVDGGGGEGEAQQRQRSDDSRRIPNLQKLKELPHALKELQRFHELSSFLCDLHVIEAFFLGGREFAEDLLLHYSECITAMTAGGNDIVPRLLEHSLFVSKWFTVLCNHPSLVYSLGANSPPTGFLSAAALDLLRSDESATPSMWFKWINATRFQDSCVQIQQLDEPVRACKLSSSGVVFAACAGKCCAVFDVVTSRKVCSFHGSHTSMVSDLCFSPSGRDVLSVGRQDSAFIWSATSGELVRTLSGLKSWAKCCAWSVTSSCAAVGCVDTTVCLFDTSSGVMLRVLESHSGPVTGCAFFTAFGADEYLATAARDHTVVIWDLPSFAPISSLGTSSGVNGLSVSCHGFMIAVACDKGCEIWKRNTGVDSAMSFALLKTLDNHASEVSCCGFSSNAQEIVTGGMDHVGYIQSTDTGEVLGTLRGHVHWLLSVSYVGARIVTASQDCTAKVWDRAHVVRDAIQKVDGLWEPEQMRGVKLVENASKVSMMCCSGRTVLLDAASGMMQVSGSLRDPPALMIAGTSPAQLSPDNRHWGYTSYDNTYNIMDIGTRINTTFAYDIRVNVANRALCWDHSGRRAITVGDGGGSNNICIIDPFTGHVLQAFDSSAGWASHADWSPDDTTVVVACQGGTLLLNLASNASRVVGPPSSVAKFSSRGDKVAALCIKGTGYSTVPFCGVIIDLAHPDSTDNPLFLLDSAVLQHSKNHCMWALDDHVVLMGSMSSSAFRFEFAFESGWSGSGSGSGSGLRVRVRVKVRSGAGIRG
jgi:WD40 repeat protein